MNKNEVFEGNKPGVFAQSEVKSLFAILNFHAHLNFFQNSIDNEFELLASAYDKTNHRHRRFLSVVFYYGVPSK